MYIWKEEARVLYSTYLEYTSVWKASPIVNKENIEAWVKPLKKMSSLEASRELGFANRQAVFYHVHKFPELKDEVKRTQDFKREIIWDMAEDSIYGFLWNDNINDMDKKDFALQVLKQTKQAYNPKQQVEVEEKEGPKYRPDELKRRIAKLSKLLDDEDY